MSATMKKNDQDGEIVYLSLTTEHYHIHRGKAFKAAVGAASLGNGATKTIAFKTPNDDEEVHLEILANSSGLATTELLEGPTISSGGTATAWKNRKRSSPILSGNLSIGASPQAGEYTVDPTITDDGEVLDTIYTGQGNNKQGGATRDQDEWELKKDTVYAIRMTSGGAANVVNLAVTEYETGDY